MRHLARAATTWTNTTIIFTVILARPSRWAVAAVRGLFRNTPSIVCGWIHTYALWADYRFCFFTGRFELDEAVDYLRNEGWGLAEGEERAA